MGVKKTSAESLTRQTLKIYWKVSKKYLFSIVGLAFLRPIYLASTYIANIYIIGIALDKLASGKSGDFQQDFGWVIISLIICGAMQIISEQLSLKVIWKFQVNALNDLTRMVYQKLLNESASFHANRFSGSLVSQTNKFTSAFERLLDTLFWSVYAMAINICFTIIILMPRIPTYTFVLIGLLVLIFVASYLANKKAKRLSADRANAETTLTGQIADSVSNIMAIKSYAAEKHESARLEQNLSDIVKKNDVLRRYTNLKDALLSLPINGITISAVLFSIYAAQKGLAPLSTLLLATTLTRDLFMRIREFNVNSQRNIARSFGDAQDMTKILMVESEVIDKSVTKPLRFRNGLIEFRDVSFQYQENNKEDLFSTLNIKVQPGEKVGLVGPSGGGKTTITKLLLRFMDLKSGQILIDDQDISELAQKTVRKVIGYVPQEPLLFHRSIAENIAYGKPDATLEEIINAATMAHAQDFIEKLPQGYETLVGERGVKLSGGQKQRIAIARTILKDAPILVLDEATSALDSESEKLIQDALWKLMKDKTAVVIAHRLSTIAHMDRILVLDEGKVVEEGSHRQLLKHGGIYAGLWSHQSGGFLEDS